MPTAPPLTIIGSLVEKRINNTTLHNQILSVFNEIKENVPEVSRRVDEIS